MLRSPRALAVLLLCFFAAAGASFAESVDLAWNNNPEPDIAGYRVLIGASSGQYTQSSDTGAAVTAHISDLEVGTTYYFAVSAYNTSGAESLPSDEVVYTVPGGPEVVQGLVNYSTRGYVQNGENVLIGGLIIAGEEPKKVVLRAIGPSLAAVGVSGVLPDPTLSLHDAIGAQIATNDNWRSGSSEIESIGLAPNNELEAALVVTLAPGAYTAVISGAGNDTGIALFEIFDADQPHARIANISTRGRVENGDNVMIGGFIIGGDQPSQVVVRALGPSLSEHGVAGALPNPTLELYNDHGSRIFANDDWRSEQEAQIVATSLAPTDDREAAIIATLPPGNYTAIVRGAQDTTGVSLVEVYDVTLVP